MATDIVENMIDEMGGEEQVTQAEQQQQMQRQQMQQGQQPVQQQAPSYYGAYGDPSAYPSNPAGYQQPPEQYQAPQPTYDEEPKVNFKDEGATAGSVEPDEESLVDSIDLGFDNKQESIVDTLVELLQTPLVVSILITLSNLQVITQSLAQILPQVITGNLIYFSLVKGALGGVIYFLIALVLKRIN